MVLKLTVYVRNVISFFYKSKTRWNSDIWNFLGEIFNFTLCFTENQLFWVKYIGLNLNTSFKFRLPENVFWGSAVFMTSLWCHTFAMFVLSIILVCMEEETYRYTMVPIRRICGVVQFYRGANHLPPPLGKPRYRKSLVRRGLRTCAYINMTRGCMAQVYGRMDSLKNITYTIQTYKGWRG